jgi:hypothetical protein
MTDIIRAVCPSCGLTIRVAGEHAGKKAKCPKCAGVITIPRSPDTAAGVVPDSELPTVGEEAPAAEPAHAHAKGAHHPPPEAAPEGAHAGGEHAHEPHHPHYERGKPHFIKKGTARRVVPMHPRSTRKTIIFAGMYALVAIAIGGLVWWMMTRPGGGLPGERAERDAAQAPPPPPPMSQAEIDVRDRFFSYIRTCGSSSGDTKKIAEFYVAERRPDVVQFFNNILESRWLKYDKCFIASVTMTDTTASMEVTFDRISTDRNTTPGKDPRKTDKDQKRTIGWTLVDGLWLIADAPAE